MLAPQSDEEIRPIVEALRRLDHRLDVVWEPKAFQTKPGEFNVFGAASKLPEFAARWQVVLRDKATSLHDEKEYTVLATVTELDHSNGFPLLIHEGPYAPIGWWLIEYMQLWDRAQTKLAEEMARKLVVAHDRAGAINESQQAAMHKEVLEKVYSEHATDGPYLKPFTGTGRTEGAPWLASRRPTTPAASAAPTARIEVVPR